MSTYAARSPVPASTTPPPRQAPCQRSRYPHTSSGTRMSGSAWTRNAISPSQSAAAVRYSADRLISSMKAWNQPSVGNVGTSAPLGREVTGYGRSPGAEDDHDADHVEGDVRGDVRDEVRAAFVDQRQTDAGEHHQRLQEHDVAPRRVDDVRRPEQQARNHGPHDHPVAIAEAPVEDPAVEEFLGDGGEHQRQERREDLGVDG